MELSVPILVSADERERWEVRLARAGGPPFQGPSLPRLLDDLALHVMETLPKESPERLVLYELCPYVELRKVKLSVPLVRPGTKAKDAPRWEGRVSVMLSRWAEDPFHVASIPRLGPEEIALEGPSELAQAVAAHLAERFSSGALTSASLAALAARAEERLEILTVDAELPSILPSSGPLFRKRDRDKKKKPAPAEPRKRHLVAPVALSASGDNLIHRALDGRLGRAHGRDALVAELAAELARPSCAVLLVGPSGAGKTALVHELVRRMAAEEKPIEQRTDVWEVDGNRLIAGMSVVGAWEARMRAVVGELIERRDVLYVRDLPALVFTGRSAHGNDNVAEFLAPHLAQGDLRIIGECTPERLEAVRDEAPGFFAHFRTLAVPELDERETWRVLGIAARAFAADSEVRVELPALDTLQGLARRFLPGLPEPGRSARLLSTLTAAALTGKDVRSIRREDVVRGFAELSGLPERVLWQKEARDPEELRRHFERRIVAQPHAWDAARDVITVLEQGLPDPGRPLASFLFVGPTGVGKTETAKALAESLFGSADRLIRFDMSELSGGDAVSRLIGDRFHPDGELTRRVAEQPFAVVLLDEIEKAHPAIFDALLQVLGEGRLTNAAGRTVSFATTVIVMTSNLGVKEGRSHLGFDPGDAERIERHYTDAAARFFRPELFNRLDRVVPFRHLGRDAILPLCERLLYELLGRRGFRRANLVVDAGADLVELLADEALDPRWGARAVKRALQRRLAVPLAAYLVRKEHAALTVVELFARDGEVCLRVGCPEPGASAAPRAAHPSPRSWPAIEAWHASLLAKLDALLADPRREKLAAERVELVGRVAGGLAPSEHARLEQVDLALEEGRVRVPVQGWASLLARDPRAGQGGELRARLEAIGREQLETRAIEELTSVFRPVPNVPWDRPRDRLEVSVRAAALDRFPPSLDLIRELREIDRGVGQRVRAFAQAVAAEEPPRLVVLIAQKGEGGFLSWVAEGLSEALGGAVTTTWWLRAGRWSPAPANSAEEVPEAIAWRVEGRGLSALLAPETGLHFAAVDTPGLVALEVIDGEDPTLLEAWTRARAEARAARTAGEARYPPLIRVYTAATLATPAAELFRDAFLERFLAAAVL